MSLYKLLSIDINLDLIKNAAICLVIFLLVGIGTSCSILPNQNPLTHFQLQENTSNGLFTDLRFNNSEDNSTRYDVTNYIEKSYLKNETQSYSVVGTWQSQLKKEGMNCKQEAVFQADGTYSAVFDCNNKKYVARISGTWQIVKEGLIKLTYTNYSPKEYNGKKIRLPRGETWSYRFINRNQIIFGNGITAYRAN